jgi:cytochrome d ubiquinol oxidase subunit II
VWLITAGGAMFAAWPLVYAASISGFYFAMLLVLFSLFFRPVGFDYRAKRDDPRWRSAWDWALFAGGFVPALVFGVAFGNLLQGVPFSFDTDLRVTYHGSFFALLNPFAVLCGLVSVAMLAAHGAAFVKMKTDGIVAHRASLALRGASLVGVALFVIAGALIATVIGGYQVVNAPPLNAVANPLLKSVLGAPGLWLTNYASYPWMVAAPAAGIVGGVLAGLLARSRFEKSAFLSTGLIVVARRPQQPDRLGCDLEPDDAADHADRRGDFPAADPDLYELGVSRDARQSDGRRARRKPSFDVLSGND